MAEPDPFAELRPDFPGWRFEAVLHAGNSRHAYVTYHARTRTASTPTQPGAPRTLKSRSLAGLRAQLAAATEPGRLRHIRGVTGE